MLILTFDEILKVVDHIFYVRHLFSNFKHNFGDDTLLKDLMMRNAKTIWRHGMIKCTKSSTISLMHTINYM